MSYFETHDYIKMFADILTYENNLNLYPKLCQYLHQSDSKYNREHSVM